ncbi:MAG: hypothetical protein KDA42_19865, partial [Planctomycetales bacterium]|nr:hypothetical protein [Planctomycetales bacterium]
YPPSQGEGELKYGVTYTVWIPDDVKTIRAVIVHQHGCGGGACRGGQTAAFDLHWQALARKHHCALLGPSYHQPEGADCRLWCDPRNGSRTTFLRALDDLSQASGHAELAHVPWCLWGHSGGAFWSSLMQTSDPQRIVAVWLRSGTAYAAWEKGEIPKPELSAAVFQIPVAFNPGFKEKMHARFNGAWNGAASMYQAYRQQGAPVLFAPDPHTAHECGDSRYLAIRFFDAHLRALGDAATSGPIPRATTQVEFALAAEEFPTLEGVIDGPIKIHPDLLDAWKQYVQTAEVADDSPPAAPYDVRVAALAPSVNEIRWRADADLESGLMQFEILRDGKTIARYPEQPRNPFGKPLFQGMSYHDTPETPLRLMRYVDPDVPSGDEHVYQIVATNGAGLSSPPSAGGSSL